MRIIESFWFTAMGKIQPIGIVVCEDEVTRDRKAYIGQGSGIDKDVDIKMICERGAKVSDIILLEILNVMKGV